MTTKTEWKVGDRVTVNRSVVATVSRVTPSGRAVVDGRTYGPDGVERTAGTGWHKRRRIEHLTPQIEDEMKLEARRIESVLCARNALAASDLWLRNNFGSQSTTNLVNVERAERLAAAIIRILHENKEDGA